MNDSYIDDTISIYDNDAENYVNVTRNLVWQSTLDEFAELVPQSNHHILDAGCSFGRDAAVLTDKGFDVSAIDLSCELLAKGRKLYPEIKFEKMDVRKLNFPAAQFGGIWCFGVLLHLKDSDIHIALKEFHRVLSPGGIIFVSFKPESGRPELLKTNAKKPSRFFNYKTKDEVETLLVKTGFSVTKSYLLNEREGVSPDKRDLEWVLCFGNKN